MATRTARQITISADRDPKKRVVKFDLSDEDLGTSGALYIDNATDKKLGSPETLTITVKEA